MRIKNEDAGMAEGDLTPMIDMTFQLIAFFMVLVNFSEAEQSDRVLLPESELAKPPEVAVEEFVTVQITKDAECIVEGNTVPVEGVQELLRRKAELLEVQGKSVPDTTVIIRAHKQAKTGQVQKVIEQCQGARFEKFVLRAKEKAGY